jgi:hypothetical protein
MMVIEAGTMHGRVIGEAPAVAVRNGVSKART